jgi:TOMM system kinase/cyclase fusion protein
MDFYEVVEQVLVLLQRQGRVSYRALKRQFDLDDEYIEDLKEEIIEAQRLAVDENGRVLVWTGKTEEAPVSASQPVWLEPQPAPQVTQAPQTEPPTEHRPPEAERRQLTVMFCDLVDSTKLSSQLDPEDYREVVRAYQSACTEVIQRFDGHVAQLLGDGLLVYFGYPQAHEDDAQRAVRSGLGIVEAIGTLNTRLEQTKGIKLAVRFGIHTGLVVVGEMGGESRQEQLALGETPNVAARIQGLAEPNTVVISSTTYRLIQGYFECQGLGEQALRGVAEPIAVYRVLGDSGVQSRLDVASTRGLTPLVGRESEVTLLLERWQQAKDGQGQVILLSGEAGIGKSRLVQVLKDHVTVEPHTRWECRSSPYYQNTALYPLTDLLQRALQWHQDDAPEQRLEKLEHLLSQYRLPLEESVPLFAPLLSLPLPDDKYPPLNLSPQRQRQKTLESIVAILLELAEREPVLFILEDLHWTDPSTLELMGLLLDQTPTASLLVLLTCRPHFQPAWHHRSYLTEMMLNRLSRSQIERIVEQVADGKRLPADVLQQIVEKTDGIPLYVEEMTKAVLELGLLKEADGQYELTGPFSSLSIPTTLQDSLMARLDRLVTAKAVAQYASVIGRQFSYALLQAVSQLDEAMLQHELNRLVEAELLYQRGLPPQATYTFKHALIQDTAYESLLRSTRQGYHRRIAEVLVDRFPEIVETQPELLAHHYTQSGLNDQAVAYWYKAGQQAIARSANREAISHLKKGLEVLETFSDASERARQELSLLTTLGPLFMAVRSYGAPEVERTYRRAQELCQQLEDQAHLFPVWVGLWSFHLVQGNYQSTREIAEQLVVLAQSQQDTSLLMEAHFVRGTTLHWFGELVTACRHLEQSIALYGAQHHRPQTVLYGQDTGTTCLSYAAWTLWMLGYPDQAQQRSNEAVTLAQELMHPFSLVFALLFATRLLIFRREWQRAEERAEAVIALTSEHGFAHYLTIGTFLQGLTLVEQGREEGMTLIRQGVAARQPIGIPMKPNQLVFFSEALTVTGQNEEGFKSVTEGIALANKMGEYVYEAELHRLKGELLLQLSSDNQTAAESCFHHAISIAQRQQAKSWQLRAATSLSRLWQRQGKRQDAYDLLAPVYGWFTEGFDTADLKDAKALLDELR